MYSKVVATGCIALPPWSLREFSVFCFSLFCIVQQNNGGTFQDSLLEYINGCHVKNKKREPDQSLHSGRITFFRESLSRRWWVKMGKKESYLTDITRGADWMIPIKWLNCFNTQMNTNEILQHSCPQMCAVKFASNLEKDYWSLVPSQVWQEVGWDDTPHY